MKKQKLEDKIVKISGWTIIAGLLAAWLAFGTVCIIYCFKVFVLK